MAQDIGRELLLLAPQLHLQVCGSSTVRGCDKEHCIRDAAALDLRIVLSVLWRVEYRLQEGQVLITHINSTDPIWIRGVLISELAHRISKRCRRLGGHRGEYLPGDAVRPVRA